jgi:hypothetical protein
MQYTIPAEFFMIFYAKDLWEAKTREELDMERENWYFMKHGVIYRNI